MNRKNKSYIVSILLALFLFCFLGPQYFEEYPFIVALDFLLLGLNVFPMAVCILCYNLKIDKYAKENHLHLWKDMREHSLATRRKAGKEIMKIISQNPDFIEFKNKLVNIVYFSFFIWSLCCIFSFVILFMYDLLNK